MCTPLYLRPAGRQGEATRRMQVWQGEVGEGVDGQCVQPEEEVMNTTTPQPTRVDKGEVRVHNRTQDVQSHTTTSRLVPPSRDAGAVPKSRSVDRLHLPPPLRIAVKKSPTDEGGHSWPRVKREGALVAVFGFLIMSGAWAQSRSEVV